MGLGSFKNTPVCHVQAKTRKGPLMRFLCVTHVPPAWESWSDRKTDSWDFNQLLILCLLRFFSCSLPTAPSVAPGRSGVDRLSFQDSAWLTLLKAWDQMAMRISVMLSTDLIRLWMYVGVIFLHFYVIFHYFSYIISGARISETLESEPLGYKYFSILHLHVFVMLRQPPMYI